MANKFVTFFDVEGARKNGWSDASIRDMLSRIEKINRGEQEQEQESEQELDIAVLPDNDVRVPLDVLKSRREQLESLYYTYGDDSTFNQICNITGIINTREEELRRDYE